MTKPSIDYFLRGKLTSQKKKKLQILLNNDPAFKQRIVSRALWITYLSRQRHKREWAVIKEVRSR